MSDLLPLRPKKTSTNPFKTLLQFIVVGLFLQGPAYAAEYNLGELARANKLELVNRSLEHKKEAPAEAIFLTGAEGDGLAWITGAEFSEGTIEVELKGKDEQGRSFVGIAFHGQNDRAFDVVYVRPFNFQSTDPDRRSHSIQYVCLPEYDWKKLRDTRPGKYESAILPSPDPGSWLKLKIVINGKNLAAFVNGADRPALKIELLNNVLRGKVGLWVGNGSEGGFQNLNVIPASK
jgi:hypothetical protein